MASVHERLVLARQVLTRAGLGLDEATLDAEVLARHVLGWDRARLVARWRDAAPAGFAGRLDMLVARRAAREPVAYITGHREFWGLDFEVTPDVLIPRPETELVIEEARLFAAEVRLPCSAVDVGTGSGCIAIALAREFPGVQVTATDMSRAALAVARRNAERLGVADRLALVEADLLHGLRGTADLIVSNPPYVAAGDAPSLPPEVRLHEPGAALFGGDADGLHIIRRLLASAATHLAPGGRLIMEFGFGQDGAVREAAQNSGWETLRVAPDLQAIPRVAVLRRPM
jgi:release factor glutamine methyltransferase